MLITLKLMGKLFSCFGHLTKDNILQSYITEKILEKKTNEMRYDIIYLSLV